MEALAGLGRAGCRAAPRATWGAAARRASARAEVLFVLDALYRRWRSEVRGRGSGSPPRGCWPDAMPRMAGRLEVQARDGRLMTGLDPQRPSPLGPLQGHHLHAGREAQASIELEVMNPLDNLGSYQGVSLAPCLYGLRR